VKIAPRAQGVSEKANYDKFVRWALPAACRPDLLGFGRTRAYSVLCYSFVGRAKGSRIDTLTDCLQRGDAKKVDLVLRRIFDQLRDTWYSPALCRAESDIARRHLDRYCRTAPDGEPKRRCGLPRGTQRLAEGRTLVIGGLSFRRGRHCSSDRALPQLHHSRRSEFGQHRPRRRSASVAVASRRLAGTCMRI
jgi:hypothetical protein